MLAFEARGPGFKYQPREIRPTLDFVLGPPDVIPLPVDQGLSSVVECCPLKPEVQGSSTSPGRFSQTLYFVLGPPDVIPLPGDQGLGSVVECCPLKPEVQGSSTSPGRFSLLFTLC